MFMIELNNFHSVIFTKWLNYNVNLRLYFHDNSDIRLETAKHDFYACVKQVLTENLLCIEFVKSYFCAVVEKNSPQS